VPMVWLFHQVKSSSRNVFMVLERSLD